MHKRMWWIVAMAVGVVACGDDGGREAPVDAGVDEVVDAAPNPLDPKPECQGAAVAPLLGNHQMVISSLAIGKASEGLDLDKDGQPDNKMAALGSLAQDSIDQSFANYELVLPIEFFDLADDVTADSCVKFAIYQGDYRLDGDDDGALSAGDAGDCNDHLAAVKPGATEIIGNGIDDDCDGLADEDGDTPSADTSDADGDGVTLADGDCDDTNDMVKPGLAEICGDGLDNDCDGVADWDVDAASPNCSPYDADLDPISLNDASFDAGGGAAVAFTNGVISSVDGVLRLDAGPSLVNLTLPVADGVVLDLQITGATIEADMVMTPAGWVLQNGKLGGVLDAHSTDQLRGLTIDIIGLRPEDSFADGIYANALGSILGLKLAIPGTAGEGCFTPDIDVDGDGLEAFCDTTPDDADKVIDKCVDGDGTTVVLDDGTTQCTEAVDANGKLRFVDGVSILLTFDTVIAVLPGAP